MGVEKTGIYGGIDFEAEDGHDHPAIAIVARRPEGIQTFRLDCDHAAAIGALLIKLAESMPRTAESVESAD